MTSEMMHESPGLRFARQALRNAKTMEEYTMHARMVEFMCQEDSDPVQARMMDDVDVPSTPPPIPIAPKCATTTTTRGAICMATKYNGEPCVKRAENGFLTCGYASHRKQEERLRKATTWGTKKPRTKRKRDEEELEHTDHSPDEIVPECPACAAGCGELTQPGPILHSERADQRFDSPGPEVRIPPFNASREPPRQRRRILPGSYTGRSAGKNPVHPTDSPEDRVILPSPTSTDEAEQTGFRTQDKLMRALTTTAFFRDPGHYISDTRARAVRACEAAAKRKADEEEKRKAEEEAKRRAEEEEKRRAEEEKRKAEEEAKRRAEEEEKRKAEEEAKRRVEEEEKRKAEEEAKHKAEEYIKSLEEGTVVDTARTLASIMESFRKGEDNRLEELCKELQGKLLHKRIEDFIKDNKFTLPVSVVKDRFEEYKITCQEPYSGDMSRARKQEEMKDRCNRRKVTANVKRAMKFRKDRLRL